MERPPRLLRANTWRFGDRDSWVCFCSGLQHTHTGTTITMDHRFKKSKFDLLIDQTIALRKQTLPNKGPTNSNASVGCSVVFISLRAPSHWLSSTCCRLWSPPTNLKETIVPRKDPALRLWEAVRGLREVKKNLFLQTQALGKKGVDYDYVLWM